MKKIDEKKQTLPHSEIQVEQEADCQFLIIWNEDVFDKHWIP